MDFKTPKLPRQFIDIYVTVLTSRVLIRKKLLYVLFWMSYAMFFETAFLNELLRHISRMNFYLVDLVRFLYSDFPQPRMKNLASIFNGFCCSSQGFF